MPPTRPCADAWPRRTSEPRFTRTRPCSCTGRASAPKILGLLAPLWLQRRPTWNWRRG
nr:virion tegument protein [synthetic construct]WNN26798.1 pUL14 [synthetic construct]